MLLHELGHIAAARSFGKKLISIRILPVGINAQIHNRDVKNLKSIVIYAGGPAVNAVLAISCLVIGNFCRIISKDMLFFISSNTFLAIFNLLPLIPLDGGMIAREILEGRFGIFNARKHIRLINKLLSCVFIVVGFFQLLDSRWNFSFILIGIFTFFSFNKGNMEAAVMNVRNIVYRRARLMKKGIYEVRDLVVVKTATMSEVLRQMDFDRFHIVYVLDDRLNILEVITEQEVIDGIIKYNSEITFEEFIKNEKK